MQIQISWLLQKPIDLDLHYLQRQGLSGFSRTRVKSKDFALRDNSTFNQWPPHQVKYFSQMIFLEGVSIHCQSFHCGQLFHAQRLQHTILARAWHNLQNDVRPAKTQISLGIWPVWSVFAVRMKKAWVLSYPLSAQRKLIRLGQCTGWSESSLGAHAILLVLSCTGLYAVKLQWLKHWCLVQCGWFKLGFESLGNYSDSSNKYLGKCSYNKNEFCQYSLELPQQGDSNEYIQHTITL